MGKSISCADAGADCNWSATAETEEELLEKVGDHCKEAHPDLEMSPELVAKVKSIMKEV